jgi:hypothetical protein
MLVSTTTNEKVTGMAQVEKKPGKSTMTPKEIAGDIW